MCSPWFEFKCMQSPWNLCAMSLYTCTLHSHRHNEIITFWSSLKSEARFDTLDGYFDISRLNHMSQNREETWHFLRRNGDEGKFEKSPLGQAIKIKSKHFDFKMHRDGVQKCNGIRVASLKNRLDCSHVRFQVQIPLKRPCNYSYK
jgi:hypothetical protein